LFSIFWAGTFNNFVETVYLNLVFYILGWNFLDFSCQIKICNYIFLPVCETGWLTVMTLVVVVLPDAAATLDFNTELPSLPV